MPKKILILSGSPKKDGNTASLIRWFCEGARVKNASVEIIETAFLKYKTFGCASCRSCQEREDYACVIDDDAAAVLKKMLAADVIVMATPLYFFGPSAQLKAVFDRMFSLYKWDNAAGTMETPLRGKTFVLIASSFEDTGLDALEKPFQLTAEYSSMKFASLLVPNAGVSGQVKTQEDIRQKTKAFGEKLAKE